MRSILSGILAVALIAACSKSKTNSATSDTLAVAQADSALGSWRPQAVSSSRKRCATIPDQDIYFVGNFGAGRADAKDNNGFISRLTPDGAVEQPRFIAGGTSGVRLHAPRGMTIVGDTLWVVDADAVRGFNRRTGAPLATVDFSSYKLGFLNDIAAGPDALYVTDTGTDKIYRIAGGRITVALQDSALGGPNGITWDASRRRFIVVPYGW